MAQHHLSVVNGLLGRGLSSASGGNEALDLLGCITADGHRVWAQIDGNDLKYNPVGAAITHVDTAGLQGGIDFDLGHGRVGVAGGYDYQTLHDNAGGKGRDNIAFVSLYGSTPIGGLALSGVLSYAHGSGASQRSTGIGNAYSNRSFDDFVGAAQIAAPMRSGGVTIVSAAGISVSDLSFGAFSETFPKSPAFALTGTANDLTSVSPYATVSISKTFVTESGLAITPLVLGDYRYNSGADGQDITLTAADGTVFAGNRAGLPKSTAILGAGLAASQGRWTAYVKYRGNLASGFTDTFVTLGAQMSF